MTFKFKDKHGADRELDWEDAIAAARAIIAEAEGATAIDYRGGPDAASHELAAHMGYLARVAPQIDRMARSLALVRNPIVAGGRVQLPELPTCKAKYPSDCKECMDRGVIVTGNNDLPCTCKAGDFAMFNTERGLETGADIKRRMRGGY